MSAKSVDLAEVDARIARDASESVRIVSSLLRSGDTWPSPGYKYLGRLGAAEFDAHLKSGGKRGGYVPSEYHRSLIELLHDEASFKSLKAQQGPFSVLGV